MLNLRRLCSLALLCLTSQALSCGSDNAAVGICGDGLCSHHEDASVCPEDCGAKCKDTDADEVCDLNDNCPSQANTSQDDQDTDGMGDPCDPCPESADNDADNDGLCGNADNCPEVFNSNQTDSDEDGIGNACDPCPLSVGGDEDGDGFCDSYDNCPGDANTDQRDTDSDDVGDACDACPTDNPDDSDNDGVCDTFDICFGGDDNEDVNGDGVPDACGDCSFAQKSRFVISFEDIYTYHMQGPLTFQVILYQDGDISFQYDQVHNIAEATIGIEAPGDDFFIPYEFDTINVPDEARILFRYNGGDYEVESSRVLDGPPFEWIDTEDGSRIQLGDDESKEVSLPFTFTFRNGRYNNINIASNGYLWFGEGDSNCCLHGNESLPTNHTWAGLLSPLWMDLNPIFPGRITVYSDTMTCQQDCAGEWDGYARIDDCGTCSGGSTNLVRDRDKDCQGTCFGQAFLDGCAVCSGGTTEHVANSDNVGCGCFEPEAGPWYPDVDGDGLGAGDALVDCRLEIPPTYVDNNDDLEPDCPTNDTAMCGECGARDCNNECNGGAYFDPCQICAGGTTGIEPATEEDANDDGIPDGCNGPDLVIDTGHIRDTLEVDYIFVEPGDCYIEERCVSGSGLRKVLRFATKVGNAGNDDLRLGQPGDENWTYNMCHEHYHFPDYAFYELYTEGGHQITTVGFKNGWCVMDLTQHEGSERACRTYNCQNQGISAGCADIYSAALDCQWVDITHIADGTYTLRVTTNPDLNLYELNYDNNSADVAIEINGDVIVPLTP